MKRIPIIAGVVALLAAMSLAGCALLSGTISLSYGGTNVPFNGQVTVNALTNQIFTITNTGVNTVKITGNLSTGLQNGLTASFPQQPASSIAVGATTNFTVDLNGSGTVVVSIPNDTNQNPFNFTIKYP